MPALNFMKRYVPAIEAGTKTGTIRKPRKDGRPHCRVGDDLKLYTGMRSPTCRLIKTVPVFVVVPIRLARSSAPLIIAGQPREDLHRFAVADGFAGIDDMLEAFEEMHGLPFEGTWISWDKREAS